MNCETHAVEESDVHFARAFNLGCVLAFAVPSLRHINALLFDSTDKRCFLSIYQSRAKSVVLTSEGCTYEPQLVLRDPHSSSRMWPTLRTKEQPPWKLEGLPLRHTRLHPPFHRNQYIGCVVLFLAHPLSRSLRKTTVGKHLPKCSFRSLIRNTEHGPSWSRMTSGNDHFTCQCSSHRCSLRESHALQGTSASEDLRQRPRASHIRSSWLRPTPRIPCPHAVAAKSGRKFFLLTRVTSISTLPIRPACPPS